MKNSAISLLVSLLVGAAFCAPVNSMLGSDGCSILESTLPFDSMVEYIEFDGGQYVDTGYHASPNSTFYCVLTPIQRIVNGMSFFGAAKGDGTAGIGDAVVLNDRYGYLGQMAFIATYGNGNYVSFSYGDTFEVIADVNSQTLSIGEAIVKTSTPTLYLRVRAEYPIFLGATNLAGSPFRNAASRYHYWSVTEDGIVVVNLIPVRIGETGFFYDSVSGELLEIQGSSTYVIGPDVED